MTITIDDEMPPKPANRAAGTPKDNDIAQEYHAFWEGYSFILSHFAHQEALWPRNISTSTTQNSQVTIVDVNDCRDRLQLYYEGALRYDCKIAAYPNYEIIQYKHLLPESYKPKVSMMFVDIDFIHEGQTITELNAILQTTLKNISKYLSGSVPTILETGGGFHVYLPLDVDYIPVFEDLADFKNFKNPSEKFMRFLEYKLTNGKADKKHSPSFKSCMIRIPNSINSKYVGTGAGGPQKDRAKVKLIQRWNGIRARPTTKKFMIDDFHVYMVKEAMTEKFKLYEARQKRERKMQMQLSMAAKLGKVPTHLTHPTPSSMIYWIEDLIENKPLADNRKLVVAIILSRYLINIKRLSSDEAYKIIWSWLSKCAELRRLEPSEGYFDRYVVQHQIELAEDNGRPPMALDTMQEKYPELYESLSSGTPT